MCGAELPQAVAPSIANGRETSFERMASIGVASRPPARRTEEPRERRVAEPREISRMEVERPAPRVTRSEGTGVTGPSFLGLSDAGEDHEDDDRYARPYGDDLYRSNWGARFLFALIVIGVVGGLGYMQLKSSHPLQAILGTQPAANSTGQQNGSAPQPNAEGQPSATDNQNAASTGSATGASASPSLNTQTSTAATGNNDDGSAQNAAAMAKGANADSGNSSKDKGATPDSTGSSKNASASAVDKNESSAGDKQPSDAAGAKAGTSDDKQSSASTDQQASSNGAVTGKKSQSAKNKSKFAKAKSSSDDEVAANTDDSGANDSADDASDTSAAAAAPARTVDNSEEPVRQAEIYLEGKGVPQNCDEGLGILHSAEARGNSRALIKLGAIYATGNCVPKDNAIAYHYFTRAHAVDPKNEWVEENRAILWANMTEDERSRARAEDGGVQ